MCYSSVAICNWRSGIHWKLFLNHKSIISCSNHVVTTTREYNMDSGGMSAVLEAFDLLTFIVHDVFSKLRMAPCPCIMHHSFWKFPSITICICIQLCVGCAASCCYPAIADLAFLWVVPPRRSSPFCRDQMGCSLLRGHESCSQTLHNNHTKPQQCTPTGRFCWCGCLSGLALVLCAGSHAESTLH